MDNNNIKKKFGHAIRKHRQIHKLTQEQLGEWTGLHRTYISEVELGERNISLENIYKLACALDIRLSQLFRTIEEDH